MKLEGIKVKTYVWEIPTERFVVKIKGLEIVVASMDDLDELIEKYKAEEPITIPDEGEGEK